MLPRRRLHHRVALFVLGLLPVAALSSCSASGNSAPTPTATPPTVAELHLNANPVIQLTEQNNRYRAPVGLDEELLVSLPGGTGGGAVWQLVGSVAPELRQITPPAATPATQVFAFHAAKTGTVTLRLRSSTGANWYAVVWVWTLNLTPKDFVPARPGIKATTTTLKH